MDTSKLVASSEVALSLLKQNNYYYDKINNSIVVDEEDLKQEAIVSALESLDKHAGINRADIVTFMVAVMKVTMKNLLDRDNKGITGRADYPEFVYPDQQEFDEDGEYDMWDSLQRGSPSAEEDYQRLHTTLCQLAFENAPTQTDAEILLHSVGMFGIEHTGRELARKYERSESSIKHSLRASKSALHTVPELREINELYGAR